MASSIPRTVTLHRIARSNALESFIADLGNRLQRINGRISSSHWTIEGQAGRQDGPARYGVKIHLQVPGAQIHAANPPDGLGDADLYQALRRAYDDAKRQLQDLQRDQRQSMGG